MSIGENICRIRSEIQEAAAAAGRDPAEILLLAATKTNDASRVREAIAAGVDLCGENRVQEMLEKQDQGAYEGCPLHFIGHLQKNKVRQVVGRVALIHGVDSPELLQLIDRAAGKLGIVQDVLLEINIGGEASKSGFCPDALPQALDFAAELPALRVRGLMAIPPICSHGAENRPYFAEMQQLFVDNSKKKYDNVYMDFLSMGMSGDFREAIPYGANILRLGSAIFGMRIDKHF